jgi:hypothetical protein
LIDFQPCVLAHDTNSNRLYQGGPAWNVVWRTKFNGNQHIFVRLSLDTHQAAVSHLIFKPSNFDYDLPISVGQVGVFISYFRPVSEEIQHIALLKSLQNHHSLPTSTMILWVLSNKIPHNSKTTKTTTPTRISFTYHLFFTSQLIVVQKTSTTTSHPTFES